MADDDVPNGKPANDQGAGKQSGGAGRYNRAVVTRARCQLISIYTGVTAAAVSPVYPFVMSPSFRPDLSLMPDLIRSYVAGAPLPDLTAGAHGGLLLAGGLVVAVAGQRIGTVAGAAIERVRRWTERAKHRKKGESSSRLILPDSADETPTTGSHLIIPPQVAEKHRGGGPNRPQDKHDGRNQRRGRRGRGRRRFGN